MPDEYYDQLVDLLVGLRLPVVRDDSSGDGDLPDDFLLGASRLLLGKFN